MPQQINLITPVLLAQKRYFSAQTMLVSMTVFLLVGGAMVAYGLWTLRGATQALQAGLATQEPELVALRAGAAAAKAADSGGDQGLAGQVQAARVQLLDRTKLLAGLQFGLMAPGRGQAARLQLVASTIPAQAWVTGIRTEADRLEVTGFTQEPAVLNDWVARLAQSPVLSGQQLARVQVARAAPAPGGSPLWAFSLVSALPQPQGVE
jgi:Tfp pilus assembly protein PilN